jgi:hypothetical protein
MAHLPLGILPFSPATCSSPQEIDANVAGAELSETATRTRPSGFPTWNPSPQMVQYSAFEIVAIMAQASIVRTCIMVLCGVVWGDSENLPGESTLRILTQTPRFVRVDVTK